MVTEQKFESDDNKSCSMCSSTGLSQEDTFCPNCGFPYNGTLADKKMFSEKRKIESDQMYKYERAIKRAKITLYILGVFHFLFSIIVFDDSALLINGVLSGAIFLCAAYYIERKAFLSIMSAFLFYAFTVMVFYLTEPQAAIRGALFQIIILSILIMGVFYSKEFEIRSKELEVYKKPKDFSSKTPMQNDL